MWINLSLSLLLTSPSPLGLFCLRATYGATVSFIKPLGSSPFQHLNKELLLWIVPMRPHVGIGGSKCLGRKKDNSCGIRLNFGSVRDPYRPTSHKSRSFGHFTVCYGIDGASSSMIYSIPIKNGDFTQSCPITRGYTLVCMTLFPLAPYKNISRSRALRPER